MKIIISDEELKEKLRLPLPELVNNNGNKELKLPDIIIPEKLGRPLNKENIDPLTKELIALDGALGLVPQDRLGQIHGVAQSEVSYLSRGFDRSNIDERKVDEDIQTSINKTKFNIIDRATTKLMESLDIFEPSSLEQKNIPDACVKMASVVERMEGKGNNAGGPNVQFHIYAPRTRNEGDYEVIQVNE